jgi:hypothetical protein
VHDMHCNRNNSRMFEPLKEGRHTGFINYYLCREFYFLFLDSLLFCVCFTVIWFFAFSLNGPQSKANFAICTTTGNKRLCEVLKMDF